MLDLGSDSATLGARKALKSNRGEVWGLGLEDIKAESAVLPWYKTGKVFRYSLKHS